jgi:hypothetical protein
LNLIDRAQRFCDTNGIDIIPQPRPEERAPKSGLPDFGNLDRVPMRSSHLSTVMPALVEDKPGHDSE